MCRQKYIADKKNFVGIFGILLGNPDLRCATLALGISNKSLTVFFFSYSSSSSSHACSNTRPNTSSDNHYSGSNSNCNTTNKLNNSTTKHKYDFTYRDCGCEFWWWRAGSRPYRSRDHHSYSCCWCCSCGWCFYLQEKTPLHWWCGNAKTVKIQKSQFTNKIFIKIVWFCYQPNNKL